jgi:steroid delta-isomerase-like uncharacterized protein
MCKIRKMLSFLIPVIGLTVMSIILVGCESQEKERSENIKTLEEKNKDIVRANFEEFFNAHNIAAVEKYNTADTIIHFSDGDKTLEEDTTQLQTFYTAFPDLHLTIDDLIAEGNKVAMVWTINGTHKSEFMGIPATGRRIELKGMDVYRMADGKIAEIWTSAEILGLMQQLGAIPSMNE